MSDDWYQELADLTLDRVVTPESATYDGPREPSPETKERVAWLEWLVAKFGRGAVARWRKPLVSLEEWRRRGSPVS